MLTYIQDVPTAQLKGALLAGTPGEVTDQVAELRNHGLRYLVVSNVSILRPTLRKGLTASAPFF